MKNSKKEIDYLSRENDKNVNIKNCGIMLFKVEKWHGNINPKVSKTQ